jgi:hypothetical protein
VAGWDAESVGDAGDDVVGDGAAAVDDGGDFGLGLAGEVGDVLLAVAFALQEPVGVGEVVVVERVPHGRAVPGCGFGPSWDGDLPAAAVGVVGVGNVRLPGVRADVIWAGVMRAGHGRYLTG